MTENKNKWEQWTQWLLRTRVDGGHLYLCTHGVNESSICFVPDIDLARYQSHLRDAYNQGLKDGREEKTGISL